MLVPQDCRRRVECVPRWPRTDNIFVMWLRIQMQAKTRSPTCSYKHAVCASNGSGTYERLRRLSYEWAPSAPAAPRTSVQLILIFVWGPL